VVGETPAAAAAQAVGVSNFQGTSIPLQLHLYTIFKNLRLQKYIKAGTSFMACGTKNPSLPTSQKEKSR
jgi:hypothetical protein